MGEALDGELRKTDWSKPWREGMGCLKVTLPCATCMEVELDL